MESPGAERSCDDHDTQQRSSEEDYKEKRVENLDIYSLHRLHTDSGRQLHQGAHDEVGEGKQQACHECRPKRGRKR